MGRGRTAAEERAEERPEKEDGDQLQLPEWFPVESVSQKKLTIGALALVVVFFIGGTVSFAMGWVDQESLERLGIPGVFIANFIASAVVLIPVPGLAALGQALIIAGAETMWVPGVYVAGVLGMTLGESTAYLAGYGGRNVAEERKLPLEGTKFGKWSKKAGAWIDRTMKKHGFIMLVVFSAIPNPFFDIVGITAGAVRMNYLVFLLAVGIGDTIRVGILIFAGRAVIDWAGIL
jgi:membrane protein DedA with SNARE-associated domain